MKKLRRLWDIMWKEPSNKKKTWGMTIFLAIFLFFTATGFQILDGEIVFHDTHWAYSLVPIGLYLIVWIGSYISYNKRGRLDLDHDLTKPNRYE